MSNKVLPAHPSLEQYKKQAKDLAKAYRSNDPEAIRRIKNNHPRLDKLPDSDTLNAKFALADAQHVIARENGFPGWTKFKEFLLFRDAKSGSLGLIYRRDDGNIGWIDLGAVGEKNGG